MTKITVGSVCSGIEAASVAWGALDFEFKWFSEIAPFPSKILAEKHPDLPNLGDMCDIPKKLKEQRIHLPDLICAGTPCQAFSLAGWKKGLDDHRGNLTLKLVDLVEANDAARKKNGLEPSIVFWENVEGVLRDKTNAFGCFLSSLLGIDTEIEMDRWPNAGIIKGPKRNVAWRILDAKYFGLPQQRRRLYLLAGGKDFLPENILFDRLPTQVQAYQQELVLMKAEQSVEIFRAYTDCLYAAYGTKWNGNAAAYNGSLFITQNGRLRRFTPLECERLMGFPDNYTNLAGARPTNRYQAVGNSWAVPVVKWLGERIANNKKNWSPVSIAATITASPLMKEKIKGIDFYMVNSNLANHDQETFKNLDSINGSQIPENPVIGSLYDIIELEAPENFYITPVGCSGILRRKVERGLSINPRLETVLTRIASQWTDTEIEAVSRKQKRGRFSAAPATDIEKIQETA